MALISDKEKALEIVRAFSDEYSRKIILALVSHPLRIEEICNEGRIPTSTCYRRIRELVRSGILKVERTGFSNEGKKAVWYTTSFKEVSIDFDSGELTVEVSSTREPEEKLYDMWTSLRCLEDPESNTTEIGRPLEQTKDTLEVELIQESS